MTVLACDVGGTRVKLGIVRDGSVLGRTLIPAHSDRGLAAGLPAIAGAFKSLCEQQQLSIAQCDGVAVSFPSLVDVSTKRILAAYGKYEDGPQIDLVAWAKETFGLPLAIENDARMAMIGEWRFGAGRGHDNLVMITLGTGLGTATIIQGQVLRGAHGQAGCLGGHLTVRHGGRRCSCGNVGCAEAEASTAYLPQIAAAHRDFESSALARERVLDYAAVLRHASGGDSVAAAILAQSLDVWGALAVSLIHAYDPEILILGGGVMAGADTILPAIQKYVANHAHTPWGKVRVVASEVGDDAALLAGEWLVREQLEISATGSKG